MFPINKYNLETFNLYNIKKKATGEWAKSPSLRRYATPSRRYVKLN